MFTDTRINQAARKKQVQTASTNLDADETDQMVELFGAYSALLAHYHKTPERAEAYFDFSALFHRQLGANVPAGSGDTKA